MFNKKAVSDVVSTVLIILLVVAAIAIIGAIVLNTVNKAGPKVDTAVACQSLDIKPNACVYDTSDGRVTSASFVRGSGGSDVTVSKVTAIFQDDSVVTKGSSVEYSNTAEIAKTFSAVDITATLPTAPNAQSGAKRMIVAATISGATEICPASLPVTCSVVA